MRALNILTLLLLAGTGLLGVQAYDQSEEAATQAAANDSAAGEIALLAAEAQAMERVEETTPLKFAEDALAEFYIRALEAGEVLGAGVRIEARDAASAGGAPQFNPFKHGLRVAHAAVQAAAEADEAPAIFSLIEEEIAAMPVAVRRAAVRMVGDTATLRLEVDVFGR